MQIELITHVNDRDGVPMRVTSLKLESDNHGEEKLLAILSDLLVHGGEYEIISQNFECAGTYLVSDPDDPSTSGMER